MCNYYLAVDIGASSGRHIIGWVQDHVMKVREIYRFSNGMESVNGRLCWNTDRLFEEITAGMRECKKQGIIPRTMGIDTWAVDYVLLDKQGRRLGESVGYRDGRTKGMDTRVYGIISPEDLYARTGIQRQTFNTIYQLMADRCQQGKRLEQADGLLMIPDYFHYLLTGKKRQEYTNATTTQLVDARTGTWDEELIGMLGYPKHLFGALSMPGNVVGSLREEIRRQVGFDCKVVLPATHDTASAVMAVPSNQEHVLYISSGTWSLMGTERPYADCRPESRGANFTNEGGYEHRYRYLKNIMGLWMIQSVKKEWEAEGERYSFGEICERASRERIASIVDCNDSCFLAPDSMCRAVADFCNAGGQQVPRTRWEMAAVIYNSLAACYGACVKELEQLTGISYDRIHIVGGGANADYLNRLTANATGRTVYAGPAEATAIGNLAAQMIKGGEYASLADARESIFRSFEIKTYHSKNNH